MTRRGDITPEAIVVAAAESVVDKLMLLKTDGAGTRAVYFIATGLPEASVTWLQTFSTALTTESGIGT